MGSLAGGVGAGAKGVSGIFPLCSLPGDACRFRAVLQARHVANFVRVRKKG